MSKEMGLPRTPAPDIDLAPSQDGLWVQEVISAGTAALCAVVGVVRVVVGDVAGA